ncbi:hypothetical protein CRV24_000067 [Beauveria bassiana]|nr:hypothetical protein CRV24_000067 [Beauveria bassiana]KAH8721420.1 hypothetical protein HC256_001776 [Beauveria bassiana]
MPLTEDNDKQTLEKYRGEFVRIIIALVRMLQYQALRPGLLHLTKEQKLMWLIVEEEGARYCRRKEDGIDTLDDLERELTNGLIAALGATAIRDDGAWASSQDTTQRLSAVIRIARAIAVRQCWLERQEIIESLPAEDVYDGDEEAVPSMFSLVRDRVRRYIVRVGDRHDAEPTPMDWLLDTRTYGFKINYSTLAEAHVWWDDQTIHYKHLSIHMSDLSNMLIGVLEEARVALAKATLCENDGLVDLPRIPWHAIADDVSRDMVGYYFLDDERNQWAKQKAN